MNFKNFGIFALLLTFVLSPLTSISHEGHETGTAKSLFGGVVKKTPNSFIEVLQEEGKVEIYVSGHDYKSLVSPRLMITAVADVKGKKIPLKLNVTSKNILVVTDLKKEKHFKLIITLKINNNDESVTFPLEN